MTKYCTNLDCPLRYIAVTAAAANCEHCQWPVTVGTPPPQD